MTSVSRGSRHPRQRGPLSGRRRIRSCAHEQPVPTMRAAEAGIWSRTPCRVAAGSPPSPLPVTGERFPRRRCAACSSEVRTATASPFMQVGTTQSAATSPAMSPSCGGLPAVADIGMHGIGKSITLGIRVSAITAPRSQQPQFQAESNRRPLKFHKIQSDSWLDIP